MNTLDWDPPFHQTVMNFPHEGVRTTEVKLRLPTWHQRFYGFYADSPLTVVIFSRLIRWKWPTLGDMDPYVLKLCR